MALLDSQNVGTQIIPSNTVRPEGNSRSTTGGTRFPHLTISLFLLPLKPFPLIVALLAKNLSPLPAFNPRQLSTQLPMYHFV